MRYARAGLAALMLAAPAMADIAAGTVLEVRLLTSLSSYRSKPGTEFEGLVVAPGCPDGLPPGTIARGVVKHIHKVGLGLVHESASMDLDFRELRLPDGQEYPFHARLTAVDNARERVNRKGSIRGIRATASLSNRMSSRLLFAVDDHPMFLIPMLVAETVLFRFPDPEIYYGPGTELHLELEDSVSMSAPAACAGVDQSAPPGESEAFQNLIAGLPYWTYSKHQHEPSDPTNLIFIGSEEEIDRAFAAAGWNGSQSISKYTGLQTLRAVAEKRGYAEAPMRTLLLDGAEPDITRQKTLNTFTKRHHLRMWKRTEQWHGRPVWASAATRDIAITFSLRTGFNHQIQSDVDLERDKVVSDLVFTGCVESVSYIRRPEAARIPEYEGKRGVTTDARVAVVDLNSCQAPREGPAVATEYLQPPRAVRCVRRVTLTLRSHIMRDNVYWHYGEGAWTLYRVVRSLIEDRVNERRAQVIARNRAIPDPPPIQPKNSFAGN